MSSDFAVFRGLGEFAGRSNFDSILSGIACLLLENLKWDDGPVSGPRRILVLARTVSILGNFAAPVALSFAVLVLAPGPEAASRLALVLAAAAVPQLLFLAVGGVAADRGHRRLLAVGGETAAGLAEAASAALLLTHTATVGALAGLAAARGAFSAAGTPAMRAFVADLADRAFGVGSVAGSGIAWRIRPQRPLLVYIALYFLEIPLRLAWALLAPLPVLAVSAGMAGLSFAAASSLWQTVLATRT